MDQAVYNYTVESSHAPTLDASDQAIPLPATMPPMPAGTSDRAITDQELMGLCAQHIVNRKALLDCPLDPDNSPHWAPYASTHDAISAARPTTLAGLAAKAQAAKSEARIQAGEEDPCNGSALQWAWDLVNDLVRLGQGAA